MAAGDAGGSVTCALCKRERRRTRKWQTTLIGLVCPSCWADRRPETAPYWRDYAQTETPGQRTARLRSVQPGKEAGPRPPARDGAR